MGRCAALCFSGRQQRPPCDRSASPRPSRPRTPVPGRRQAGTLVRPVHFCRGASGGVAANWWRCVMDMAGVQSGMVGMALFDAWMASFKKLNKANRVVGSPLVAAAAEAFEQYVQTAEIGHAAQISGIAMYALNPAGNSVSAITQQ